MTHHGINPWRFVWSLMLLLPAIFCLFPPFFHVCFIMWIINLYFVSTCLIFSYKNIKNCLISIYHLELSFLTVSFCNENQKYICKKRKRKKKAGVVLKKIG